MQVAGDLAGLRAGLGLVAQPQTAELQLIGDLAGQGAGPIGVVVADHPDEPAP